MRTAVWLAFDEEHTAELAEALLDRRLGSAEDELDRRYSRVDLAPEKQIALWREAMSIDEDGLIEPLRVWVPELIPIAAGNGSFWFESGVDAVEFKLRYG